MTVSTYTKLRPYRSVRTIRRFPPWTTEGIHDEDPAGVPEIPRYILEF